jgi:hypothetical protein
MISAAQHCVGFRSAMTYKRVSDSLKADVGKQLSIYGEISTTISVPIKHDAGERKCLDIVTLPVAARRRHCVRPRQLSDAHGRTRDRERGARAASATLR